MNTNIMVIRMTTFIVELFEVSLVEDSFPVDYKLLQPAREVFPVDDRDDDDDDDDDGDDDVIISGPISWWMMKMTQSWLTQLYKWWKFCLY